VDQFIKPLLLVALIDESAGCASCATEAAVSAFTVDCNASTIAAPTAAATMIDINARTLIFLSMTFVFHLPVTKTVVNYKLLNGFSKLDPDLDLILA
jgi:hypothetical protein